MAERATSGRSLVVLAGLGLAGGGVAALAGTNSWVKPTGSGEQFALLLASVADASAPLTTALSLVVLAAWGVVLVTRGWFRRVVLALAALASVGVLVASVIAFVALPRRLSDYLAANAFSEGGVHRTVWGWLAIGGAVLAVAAAGLGLGRVRTWPEMGRRYDAPAVAAAGAPGGESEPGATVAGEGDEPAEAPVDLSEADNIDLWKQLDQGRDPTV